MKSRRRLALRDNDLSYKIARVILPVLLYFIIAVIVQAAVTGIVVYNDIKSISSTDVNANFAYMFTERMESIVSSNAMLITLITALITIPMCVIIIFRDKKTTLIKELRKTESNLNMIFDEKLAFFALIPAGMLASAGFGRFVSIFPLDNILGSYEKTQNIIASAPLAIRVLAVIIFVPIMEELLFRGCVFNRIKEHNDNVMAAYLSALIFGIYHMNLMQGIYAFVLGIFLAVVYEKFGTIVAPIVMHMAANLMAFIMQSNVVSGFIDRYFLLKLVVLLVEVGLCALTFVYIFSKKKE